MADAPTSTVIVALPAADDPVHSIGDEPKHATLCFLGDDVDPADVDAVRQAVAAHVAAGVKDGTLGPFTEKVTGVDSLGDKGARVWSIQSDDGLTAEHDELAAHPVIAGLMGKTEQFPSYTPHVTVGYPAEGAKRLDDGTEKKAAAVDSIRFDRLAVWSGDDQTEFPLTATREGGAPMAAGTEIREAAGSITERAAGGKTPGQDGIWPVQIISAGWGSSGYYRPDVLREAADQGLIQAGTPVFFDHSSETERRDRPERSVRDIAAVFTGPATYDAKKRRLVGEVQVFSPYRDLVAEIAPHIGLSISGSATDVTHGTAEGRNGPIVEGLAHINSVDMVTKAGRGGKFLNSLMESAREQMADEPVIPALADAPLVESYSALLEAGGQAVHAGDTERLMTYWAEGEGAAKIRWGVDGDFNRCVMHLGKYVADPKGLCSNLHVRATGARPGHAAGESARTADPTHVPAVRPDGSRKGATMPKIEIEESEHTRLTETAGRVATLESEKRIWEAEKTSLTSDLSKVQAELTEAKSALLPNKDLREALARVIDENARLRAEKVAAPLIAEALEDALIGETAKKRLAGELVEGLVLKEGDDGFKVLDTAALVESINTKVRVAEAEAQELREAMGVGQVRGLPRAGGGLVVEQKVSEYTGQTATALQAFGLSESAAKTAAQGR